MAVDILIMFINNFEFLRFITKPAIILLLILYYASNDRESISKDFVFTVVALSFFLLANVATLLYKESLLLIAASVFFILGKVFYIFRFSNSRDFDIIKFLPFLGLYLIYMFIILNLTLDNLGSSLIPVFLFLFVTLLAVQFAFLRKGMVSKSSYQLVIYGMFIFATADTVSILGSFFKYWPWARFVTMIAYAMAQYLIIMGLVKEKREEANIYV